MLGCRSAPAPLALDDVTRAAIADTVRAVSNQMLAAMAERNIQAVLGFYGRHAAYVGNGKIGDWAAIVAEAPARYATYTKVACVWGEPLRIDVVSRTAAVLTAMFDCQKSDQSGRSWRELAARTEVLAPEDGRWRIVAVHESIEPGSGEFR
jgi:uncharacterized protein (TIGR02246 family)